VTAVGALGLATGGYMAATTYWDGPSFY